MASTYSSNLRLELITTGEQQGQWGSTTNNNLGTLLEQAIGGYESITVSNVGDTTLTTADGAVDQARNMVLNLTGTISAARNVICPSAEKVYIVRNATTGGFAVTLKVTGQTGISIPNGATFVLYVDGTDVRQATGSIASGGTGAATAAAAATNLGLGTTDSPQFSKVNLSAGTALLPSLFPTGDTNTGVWFPAADTIAASTGGSERLRVDSAGNVGIGTTNISKKFVVSNGGASGLEVDPFGRSGETATSLLSYNRSGAAFVPAHYDALNHLFYTSTTERMRIDGSGNVGIGTSTITSRLLVSSASGSAPNGLSGNCVARLQSTQAAAVGVGPSLLFEGQTGNPTANYAFAGIQGFKASATAGDYTGSLAFYTQNSGGGSALDEKMRIDGITGNVGIGRTPVYKLDVAINSGGAARFATNSGTAANDAGVLMFTTASATPATREAGVYVDGNGGDGTGADYAFFLHRGDNRAILGNQGSGTLEFQTSGIERMRIDASGNVLVTGPGGLGYGTGSGGTVTQLTSKATLITLNKTNGRVTMNNAALGAGAAVSFQVNNNTIGATDNLIITPFFGAVNPGNYNIKLSYSTSGFFIVNVTNISGGSLSEALEFNFAVIKSATA